MSILLTRDIVLSDAATEDPDAGHIGWHSFIKVDNIAADYAEQFFPITNLANSATNEFWRSVSLNQQYITVNVGLNSGIDYVGFANHNLGSGVIAYRLEGSNDGMAWTAITEDVIPESDAPHVQVFELAIYTAYRIRLTPTATTFPRISCSNIGKMLVLQRRIYVGHTPITMGDDTTVTNNRSETGQFLGRIVRREFLTATVAVKNLSADWVRTYFLDFKEASKTLPFFWAWRPLSYPMEVGYCWLMDDIALKNQRANGMMNMSMQMQGIGKFVAEATNDLSLASGLVSG